MSFDALFEQAAREWEAKHSAPPFKPSPFTFIGYVARVVHHQCECGCFVRTLEGVFSEKIDATGSRHLVRHEGPRATDAPHRVEITTISHPLCPDCLSTVGFPQP